MQDIFQNRQFSFQFVFGLAATILALRCLHLQVLDNSYKEGANYQQGIVVYPARGLMYDRNNKQMVNNQATYDLMVTYNLAKGIDTAKFCKLLNITKEEYILNIEKDFKRDKRFAKHKPFVFMKNIPAAVYNRFAESLYEFHGFEGQVRGIRGYDVVAGAHVLGYISEVTQEQIEKSKGQYTRGDYIGTSGLEFSYDKELKGINGVKHILIDNLGRQRGSYRDGKYDVEAEAGLYLQTTLDLDLQKYGEELMANKKGSIVAIEPSTGEILALISSPTYDPNLLIINRNRGGAFSALSNNDTLKPLLNRAIQSKYPPGSIFKPIMALIGLQMGTLKPDQFIPCRGGYYYGNRRLGCHGHPSCSNPASAIQHSCNAYFCQTFRDIVDRHGYSNAEQGLKDLDEYLYRFGLGKKLGVDIPNESPGNIPTSEFYNRMYKKGGWTSPTIISMGIGQGEVLVTPIQMANMAAIIANRGFFYTPHLAKSFTASQEMMNDNDIESVNNKVLSQFKQRRDTGVDTGYYRLVVDGMELVMVAGTGRRSKIDDISMCGKTGTVENPHGKDHSAFIAFAPKENPKIAIAVFVENSGFGATYAAPIASLMIEKYIRKEISEKRKSEEQRILKAKLY